MKKTIALIYGGNSPEHDVSVMTAESIRKYLDKEIFDLVDVFIDKDGFFDEEAVSKADVAFLAVHGPNCEDGKLQQKVESLNTLYTGSGVDASRVNMDKIEQHNAFKKAGLPIVDFISATVSEGTKEIKKRILEFGLPVFIKPNNAGSSIGVNIVKTQVGITPALNEAFKYDDNIIIERALTSPREIELGVLGNGEELLVSYPGEILTGGDFYSYTKKYFEPFETAQVASGLSEAQIKKVRDLASKAYIATGCSGYARVDFFLDGRKFYINEINTLPGFTKSSMYPTLMKNVGIEYSDLITRIIELAN